MYFSEWRTAKLYSIAKIVKSTNNNTSQTPMTLKTVSRLNSQISIILGNVIFCNFLQFIFSLLPFNNLKWILTVINQIVYNKVDWL